MTRDRNLPRLERGQILAMSDVSHFLASFRDGHIAIFIVELLFFMAILYTYINSDLSLYLWLKIYGGGLLLVAIGIALTYWEKFYEEHVNIWFSINLSI